MLSSYDAIKSPEVPMLRVRESGSPGLIGSQSGLGVALTTPMGLLGLVVISRSSSETPGPCWSHGPGVFSFSG